LIKLSKKKKKKNKTYTELLGSLRGSWNGVNPVTRVIPDKRKKKPKHKGKEMEYED
jgi:hypothetical protein